MAIDWSILGQQTQPTGKVVANIPQQPSALNSLASGIMNGVQQGQNIAATSQAMAAQKQQMDQSAALFPGQQQMQQQAIQTSQNALDATAKANKIQAEVTAGFQKSTKDGLAVLGKYDMEKSIKIQQGMEDIKKSVAETMSLNAKANSDNANADKAKTDSNKETLDMQDTFLSKAADAFNVANRAEQQKPGSGQKVLDMLLGSIPPDMLKQSHVPTQLTPDSTFTMSLLGKDAHDRLYKKNTPATETSKAQDVVAQRQQEFDSISQENGPDSPEAKQAKLNLDQATQAAANSAKDTSIGGTISRGADAIGSVVDKLTGSNAPSTTTSTLQKGVVYPDASGNKAKYLGGDPKDKNSWQEVK